MGLSPDADAVLHDLADAAGTDRDLVASLDHLLELATEAVPSCLGVSLTLSRNGAPVILTVLPVPAAGHDVRSSLAIRLPSGRDPNTTGRALTLYASTKNAFGATAGDLLMLLDLDPHRAITDGHLDLPPRDESGRQLREQLHDLSAVDQALGVLLDRGLPLGAARGELERLAIEGASSIADAAHQVLDAVRQPPPGTAAA